MQREIKFRAWINGRMRTDCLIVLSNGEVDISVHQMEAEGLYIGSDDDVPLMQYTGLKDKNGKEIYEGDVMQYKTITIDEYMIFSVEYDTEKARFVERIKEGAPLSDGSFLYSDRCEIIGNIYETPELITS